MGIESIYSCNKKGYIFKNLLGINIRKNAQNLSEKASKCFQGTKKHLNHVLGWENEHHKIVHSSLDSSEFNQISMKMKALLLFRQILMFI